MLKWERINIFAKLEDLGQKLDAIVAEKLSGPLASGKLSYVRKASFFCFFFGTKSLHQNFEQVAACDMKKFNKIFHAWLAAGVYMGPSGYEVGFLSSAHEISDLEKLVGVVAAGL